MGQRHDRVKLKHNSRRHDQKVQEILKRLFAKPPKKTKVLIFVCFDHDYFVIIFLVEIITISWIFTYTFKR